MTKSLQEDNSGTVCDEQRLLARRANGRTRRGVVLVLTDKN